MEDCIIISDEECEDVQVIQHLVHLDREPIVIDLTSGDTIEKPQPQWPPIPKPQSIPKPQPNNGTIPQPQSAPKPQPQSAPIPKPQSPPIPHPQSSPIPQPQSIPKPQPNNGPIPQPQWAPTPQPQWAPTPQPQRPPVPQPQRPPIPHPQSAPIPQPQWGSTPQPERPPVPQPQIPSVTQPQSTPTPPNPQPTAPSVPPLSDLDLMIQQKALGNEKYKHNLFNDAIKIYKRALELGRKLGDKEISAIVHFNLAMTYYKVGSFDQAADECANAVKINDNYMKAHLKRAEIYQRQGKFEEAVICYEHICELDNSNPDYVLLLNHAREASKKTKKKDYYELLGLRPSFTKEDLRKAYRQQALNHHPDRHSDADIVTRRIEEKLFKEASEAHTWIKMRMGFRL